MKSPPNSTAAQTRQPTPNGISPIGKVPETRFAATPETLPGRRTFGSLHTLARTGRRSWSGSRAPWARASGGDDVATNSWSVRAGGRARSLGGGNEHNAGQDDLTGLEKA